jgi:hypothetical protein
MWTPAAIWNSRRTQLTELYEGQIETVRAQLAQDETIQQADRELLAGTTDPDRRQVILRRIAGREGSLSTRRRFLAQLEGGTDEGAREKSLRIRLTDDEYARLRSAAEENGLTIAQYVRSRVL